jgi:hypothetical protein
MNSRAITRVKLLRTSGRLSVMQHHRAVRLEKEIRGHPPR